MNLVVSIIMPARDMEKYIATAIDSVIAQKYPHWELIVVENASTDRTAEIVKNYSDPRIKLFHTDTPGLSNARNIGLSYAKGDLVCFLDADDRLPMCSISARVEKMMADPEVLFVDGGMEKFNADFTQLVHSWKPSFRGIPSKEMMLLLPGCFCGITWMIRRKEGLKLEFDTSWTHLEDRVFFLSISAHGKYDYVDRVTYHIRRRPGSLMTNLRLLERAYARYLVLVHQMNVLDESTKRQEVRAFHRMFYRTYLKHGRLLGGLRHWFFLVTHAA